MRYLADFFEEQVKKLGRYLRIVLAFLSSSSEKSAIALRVAAKFYSCCRAGLVRSSGYDLRPAPILNKILLRNAFIKPSLTVPLFARRRNSLYG